jgi:hypothetical protein
MNGPIKEQVLLGYKSGFSSIGQLLTTKVCQENWHIVKTHLKFTIHFGTPRRVDEHKYSIV